MKGSYTSSLQCATQPRGKGSRYRTEIPPQGAARDTATRGDPSPDISASEEDPVSRWGARASWRGSMGTSSTKFSSIESSSRECATCAVEISHINRSKIFLFLHSPLSSNHPHRRWNPQVPHRLLHLWFLRLISSLSTPHYQEERGPMCSSVEPGTHRGWH